MIEHILYINKSLIMKILFATPYSDIAGGINQWAKHIISYYEKIESEVEIELMPMNSHMKGDPSIVSESTYRRILNGILTYSKVVNNLKASLRKSKYDILHIASSASISLLKDYLMIKIAKKQGVKTALHFHFGRIPELAKKNNWEWKLLTKVVKMSDVAIVIDQASYDTLLKAGYKNIALLPNPLSPRVESLIEQYKDIKRVKGRIVFVGHCIVTKGVYELVKACKNIDNIELRLIGPIRDDVKADLINISNGEEWLKIQGKQPFEEVIREMMSCNVFALPTYTEGFPNVIIESMACGCPIITTPVGAIPEMLDINGEAPCGVCVEVKNTEELKNVIEEFLRESAYTQEYGVRAQERVRELYQIDKVWNKLIEIWISC